MRTLQTRAMRFCVVFALVTCAVLLLQARGVSIQAKPSLTRSASLSTAEVFVPSGQFSMGCATDLSPVKCDSDASPIHSVYVDAFYIDRTEVTNAQYAACVAAGACREPLDNGSATRPDYFTNPAYADHPVLHVDWGRAGEYCGWVGKRLPTEAEWEKAARGTDLRWYPWGNDEPGCERLNFTVLEAAGGVVKTVPCEGDTVAVGSYPLGASPYGALDMAGNVREWVQDLYDSRYYHNSPYYNPQGPVSTDKGESLVRGGSWADHQHFGANTWVRIDEACIYDTHLIGFRCARSASQPPPEVTPTPTPKPTPTPTPFSVRAVDEEGGLMWLAYPGHLTMLHVPAGALAANTVFTLAFDGRTNNQGELQGLGHFFSLETQPPLSDSISESSSLVLPLELALGFNRMPGIISGSLALYRLGATGWSTGQITVVEETGEHVLALIGQAGTYGLLGRTERAYLPVILHP